LLVNFTHLMSIITSVALILMVPYSKLYHDLRGGIVKLMGLAKLSRFALTFVELHFEDYTFDRLREIATTSEDFRPDPYILMGAYQGRLDWAVIYSLVLYFHMANMNNLFNSDDAMVFTVTLLMSTKYIGLSKNGKASPELTTSVCYGKVNDLIRDLLLWYLIKSLSDSITNDFVFKGAVYILSIVISTCSRDWPDLQSIHYYSIIKGKEKFLNAEWRRTFVFLGMVGSPDAQNFKEACEAPKKEELVLGDRDFALADMPFVSCWSKVMIRSKSCVLPFISIVGCTHLRRLLRFTTSGTKSSSSACSRRSGEKPLAVSWEQSWWVWWYTVS
jgi:hypothetical protein